MAGTQRPRVVRAVAAKFQGHGRGEGGLRSHATLRKRAIDLEPRRTLISALSRRSSLSMTVFSLVFSNC